MKGTLWMGLGFYMFLKGVQFFVFHARRWTDTHSCCRSHFSTDQQVRELLYKDVSENISKGKQECTKWKETWQMWWIRKLINITQHILVINSESKHNWFV